MQPGKPGILLIGNENNREFRQVAGWPHSRAGWRQEVRMVGRVLTRIRADMVKDMVTTDMVKVCAGISRNTMPCPTESGSARLSGE